jgi:hypothetical protein
MHQKEIQSTWKKLIIPFAIGIIILTIAILFHRLGSKRPGPQAFWALAGILGAVFVVIPGLKMIKFRKYLRSLDENS